MSGNIKDNEDSTQHVQIVSEKLKLIKKCYRCKKEFDLTEFHKDNYSKDKKKNCCKACSIYFAKRWQNKQTRERTYNTRRRYMWKLKLETFKKYGNRCQCCEENNPYFLTMDHINGGGHKHRKERDAGVKSIYLWLKKNNYPEGFQVLCWNCNCGKGIYQFKECPHKISNFSIDVIEAKVILNGTQISPN